MGLGRKYELSTCLTAIPGGVLVRAAFCQPTEDMLSMMFDLVRYNLRLAIGALSANSTCLHLQPVLATILRPLKFICLGPSWASEIDAVRGVVHVVMYLSKLLVILCETCDCGRGIGPSVQWHLFPFLEGFDTQK